MADVDAALSNLFAELRRLENNGEYEKALKTAGKVLGLSQNNQKAVQCKVVCLIQMGEFEEALKYMQGLNDDLKSSLNFEKSYCEYRLNRIRESLESLKLADSDDFAVSELKIQALYRIEEFDKCYTDYVNLIKNSGDEYEDERYVNLSAVSAGLALEKGAAKSDLLDLNENTYEVIYNKACILIASGNYVEAIKKLNEADAFCRKFLEEDGATEEEIEAESAIIKTQLAFCQQKLGKNDISLKMYNQILRQKADLALIAVSSNNVVAIHKDQNVFDSKKKIKIAMNESSESKLSSSQKRNIFFNYCLFLINTNQFDLCRKELEVFKKKFSDSSANDATVIESYLYLKEKNEAQAIKVLSSFCSSKKAFEESDLELVLLLTQMHIKAQNFKDAIQTLEKLGNLKYLPAILSALYVLYEKENNLKAIEDLFLKAIKWHESQKSSASILANLYREAAKFYLNQNKPQVAVKHLEKIVAVKGKNAKITSMLINAYAQFDAAKAQSLQNDLPSVEEILASVDIEHLENKNWSLGVKYVKKSKDTPKAPERKKKKNRKKILPKNYNPSEQPDPERWLPKYERSNYRKKKDKKGVGKGTQGAIGEAPEIKPSPKPLIPSPQGPRQQRPSAAQKKKKKGGRK